MLFTDWPFTFDGFAIDNGREGVTLTRAAARVTFAVTARNAESEGCIEIQRPASLGTRDAGSPKKEVIPCPLPEMYATPPTSTTDASSFPMATVCSPESTEESWTTLPVVEPEKNSTVILTEPAPFAALSEFSSVFLTELVERTAADAEPSAFTDKPSKQATMTSPIRAALEVRRATGILMADAR
jgi:hypothetical protein